MPQMSSSTNWVVITGAPCSGKSTVIEYMKQCGLNVVSEVALDYIEEQKNEGNDEPWEDLAEFQTTIYRRQQQIEDELLSQGKANDTLFFDRGVPDSLAYFEYHNIDASQVPQTRLPARYKHVFLFERPKVTVKHDVDGENPSRLINLLKDKYSHLGYKLHLVPFMPVEQRAQYILHKVKMRSHIHMLRSEHLPQSKTLLPCFKGGYWMRTRPTQEVEKNIEDNGPVHERKCIKRSRRK